MITDGVIEFGIVRLYSLCFVLICGNCHSTIKADGGVAICAFDTVEFGE